MKKIFLAISLSTLVIFNLPLTAGAFTCTAGMDPAMCTELSNAETKQATACEKILKQADCVINCSWSASDGKCKSQGTPIFMKCSEAGSESECGSVPVDPKCSWNAATKKCTGDITLYTTLNTLYTEGTDFVKNLAPKSGMGQYQVIVDIPCDNTITKMIGGASCATTQNYTNSIPLYVARLYQFGFGIVGAVALLMIIIGAAKYTLSAGSFTSKDEARQQITEAIYGILLLFGAYLILYTINPGLVSIKAPTLTPTSVNNLSAPAAVQTPPVNTNTPAENIGTNPIENCMVPKPVPEVGCSVCNDGYTLNSAGKCVGSQISGACASGYLGTDGKCAPCSSVNGYDNPAGGCTLCSSGYVVSGVQCLAK